MTPVYLPAFLSAQKYTVLHNLSAPSQIFRFFAVTISECFYYTAIFMLRYSQYNFTKYFKKSQEK